MVHKTRLVILLAVALALVLFARENWHYPSPPLTFFGWGILPLPLSLSIYFCLVLGFVAGWVAHALKHRRGQKAAPPETPEPPKPPHP